MGDPRTDDQLLSASAVDAEAFGLFYRRHAEAILAYLHSRTGDIEVAADLTADVFAGAFASRARYRVTGEPARAWLFGIANNLLAMNRRKRRRADAARRRLGVGRLELHDEALERAEAKIVAAMEGGLVQALVADLPTEHREAVVARIIDERSYREIAQAHGCTESVVRQRVSRGLARVGMALQKERA